MEQSITRKPDYRDLDLNFEKHPATGDVSKLIGAEAIKRSIRNLVLTHFYERKFQHSIGSNVTKLLFENINPMTANFLENAISEVIYNYEPRANLLEVSVTQMPDQNQYEASVVFKIRGLTTPVTFSLFLKRIR